MTRQQKIGILVLILTTALIAAITLFRNGTSW